MSYILFVDESGQDHRDSPYEVLAGFAIKDSKLWKFVTEIQSLETKNFGRRYSMGPRELKGKKLLKNKTFRQAAQMPSILEMKRCILAKECLERGEVATKEMITALAQAKISFVLDVLDTCLKYDCKAIASIVSLAAPRPHNAHAFLRKDYSYLLERYFYYLEDAGAETQGFVVFDELEKSRSNILVDQMQQYFQKTQKGRGRSSRIIPEPFFVHSELTTGVQIADLIAYVTNWGLEFPKRSGKARDELNDMAQMIKRMEYCAKRDIEGKKDFVIPGFNYIDDLRPANDRQGRG